MLAAGVFVLGGKLVYSSWTDAQIEKNNLLKKEIVKLDAQIADIQDLENRKQRLVARMEIIETAAAHAARRSCICSTSS